MTIQRISITEINYAIRWIVISPVDSAIQRLNNRGLPLATRETKPFQSFSSCHNLNLNVLDLSGFCFLALCGTEVGSCSKASTTLVSKIFILIFQNTEKVPDLNAILCLYP